MAFLRNTVRAASHVRAAAAPLRPARIPRIQLARAFSTENEKPAGSGPPKNNIGRLVLVTVVLAFGITTGVYVTKSKEPPNNPDNYFKSKYDFVPTVEDYQKVYNDIANGLESKPEYDAGSYAPILLRLSWHSSGTYSKERPTGGSNGATMRFPVEAGHGANNGLGIARNYLEPIKEKYPWISYSDLWTIGGVCALQEMDGPKIEWRPGRKDKSEAATPPDGRLPDGAKGADHLRNIFYRLGYNDQEIVALSGAHGMGECHRDRSGFDGPWTFTPISFTNQFFTLLLDETWKPRDWDGNFQYQDQSSKSLMMLPTDYCLIEDPSFKKYVELYAKDEDRFREDFKKVYTALIEKGVPEELFEAGRKGLGGKKTIVFQTTAEQDNDKRE